MVRQLIFTWGVVLCGGIVAAEDRPKVDFARDIRPILANHCWSCHGQDEAARKGKLRLDQRESALARKAIVPGDPHAGSLIERIEAEDESERMPPAKAKKDLNPKQKQLLRDWIAQGAEFSGHWAFTAPKRPEIPKLKDSRGARNPADHFVRARLESEGLSPSPEADRPTLLRRVTLDLTGLPPTLEEQNAFLADKSDQAYERVVDRLLESPRHAERMAMTWLDAARYADTNGYNNDEDRSMWPWRDWVIASFRRNQPYDQFVVDQLAGDLLPKPTLDQKIASGFHRNQGHNTEGGIIPEEYRVEYVADRVHATATVFLGLSMQCARCHDHKYDPFSQADYYRFYGFFNSLDERQGGYRGSVAQEPFVKVPSDDQSARLADMETKLKEIERRVAARERETQSSLPIWEKAAKLSPAMICGLGLLSIPDASIPAEKRDAASKTRLSRFFLERTDEPYIKLARESAATKAKIEEIDKSLPVTMIMRDLAKPRDTFVLKRGAYDQPGEKVEPDVPASLPPLPPGVPRNRLGLARWIVDPAHPLTARVAVNRWWETYFGTGLVKTVEDFGAMGETPSHPELLDYLATELVKSGWNVRAIQHLIVTSATYRQVSRQTKELRDRDPENRLLARGPRFRLPAETVRDNALAISGLLAEQIGGPSVKPYQPAGLWEDVSVERRAKYVPDSGPGLYRRSMYTFWKRTCPPPSLMSFDANNREVCVVRRGRTNTPLQALILMNDPTYLEAARNLAQRVIKAETSDDARLTLAFRLAASRPPRDEERPVLSTLLKDASARFRSDKSAAEKLTSVGESPRDPKVDTAELAAWTATCSTILNLDEVISKR